MAEHAFARPVAWRRTGSRVFALAARVEDTWWVLRHNSFPEHPLRTLFVGGVVAGDVDDPLPGWDLRAGDRPALTDRERADALTPVHGLGRYGSEVGRPCDGDWCSCDHADDEFGRGPEAVQAG